MIAKGASVPFEDERYAYVAVSRAPVGERTMARIIKPPVEAKAIGIACALFSFPLVLLALTWLDPLAAQAAAAFGLA